MPLSSVSPPCTIARGGGRLQIRYSQIQIQPYCWVPCERKRNPAVPSIPTTSPCKGALKIDSSLTFCLEAPVRVPQSIYSLLIIVQEALLRPCLSTKRRDVPCRIGELTGPRLRKRAPNGNGSAAGRAAHVCSCSQLLQLSARFRPCNSKSNQGNRSWTRVRGSNFTFPNLPSEIASRFGRETSGSTVRGRTDERLPTETAKRRQIVGPVVFCLTGRFGSDLVAAPKRDPSPLHATNSPCRLA